MLQISYKWGQHLIKKMAFNHVYILWFRVHLLRTFICFNKTYESNHSQPVQIYVDISWNVTLSFKHEPRGLWTHIHSLDQPSFTRAGSVVELYKKHQNICGLPDTAAWLTHIGFLVYKAIPLTVVWHQHIYCY